MLSADAAFGEQLHALYTDHHGWLVRWLFRRLGCNDNAKDIAQDTFVRVLGKQSESAGALPPLQNVREPRAWLTTIAHGLAVDHVRRRELERAYLEAVAHLPEELAPSPEDRLLLLEALARIDAMLDGLAPKARTAFLLSRLEGLRYSEIAAQMKVSLSSVEKYMAIAMRHCIAAREAA